ncbi:MAG: DUF4290 domain-containing protein [Bacteroidota bacterium]
MEYKITDEPLKLREYGRNVQQMVKFCKTIEDPVERNVLAREIVRIMANMNPGLRDGQDFHQKLWDHFYHLAEFDIDVDSEYPVPEPDSIFSRPTERMQYHNRRSRFRQYGQNIELMADAAINMEDDEQRKHALVTLTLNIMKMHLKGQEKDSNAELIVCEHLRVLTKGKLTYRPDEIKFHRYTSAAPPPQQQSSSGSRKNKGNKRHKGNRSYNKGRR